MMKKTKINESHIRNTRLIKNMSKKEVAYKSGITYATLDGLEKGRIKCNELNARRLAMVFNVPDLWRDFLTDGKFIPANKEKEYAN